jgi:hypothetical protein
VLPTETAALPPWLLTWPPEWLLPWHISLALALVALGLSLLARTQLERAREDWANAFFYSPSQKSIRRQRRKRWQEWMWALLAATGMLLLITVILYLRQTPVGQV